MLRRSKPLKFNKIVCVSDDVFSLLGVPLYYLYEYVKYNSYNCAELNALLEYKDCMEFIHADMKKPRCGGVGGREGVEGGLDDIFFYLLMSISSPTTLIGCRNSS